MRRILVETVFKGTLHPDYKVIVFSAEHFIISNKEKSFLYAYNYKGKEVFDVQKIFFKQNENMDYRFGYSVKLKNVLNIYNEAEYYICLLEKMKNTKNLSISSSLKFLR